jgi:hypothetical protein
MTAPNHPSYLELDRTAAKRASEELRAADLAPPLQTAHEAAVDEHLTECESCRAHLAQLAATRQAGDALPAWLLALEAQRAAAGFVAERVLPDHAPKLRLRPWPTALIGTALACAAAFALVRAPSEPAYDTTKGAASVWVHVQHEGVRGPWDGAPLTAGDRIRLELAPDRFRHVTVFSVGASDADATLLHRSALRPHVRSALDKAWQLDASGTSERLLVVFARDELSVAAARRMLREPDPKQAQVIELLLPKRGTP